MTTMHQNPALKTDANGASYIMRRESPVPRRPLTPSGAVVSQLKMLPRSSTPSRLASAGQAELMWKRHRQRMLDIERAEMNVVAHFLTGIVFVVVIAVVLGFIEAVHP